MYLFRKTLLLWLFFLSSPLFVFSAGDGFEIRLNIEGCNNNNICESQLAETFGNCPNDCLCNNNNVCESQYGEDENTCPNDCVITPTTEDGNIFYGFQLPELEIFNIKSVTDSKKRIALISWETSFPVQSIVYWGQNQDFEIATFSSFNFTKKHSVKIENIEYGQFNFLIEIKDFYGRTKFSEIGIFNLIEPTADLSPNNPSNFRIFPTESGIGLAWTNPSDKDFSRVRLVREEKRYPATHLDGKVVYEGGGQSVIDYDVVDGKTYYYTIFSIDQNGNVSSGSVIKIQYLISKEKYEDKDKIFDPQKELPDYVPIENYRFFQNDIELYPLGGVLAVVSNQPLRITIDKKYIKANQELVLYFNTTSNQPNSGYKFIYLQDQGVYEVISDISKIENQETQFAVIFFDKIGQITGGSRGVLIISMVFDGLEKASGFDQQLIPGLIFWLVIILVIYFSLFLIFKLRKKSKK